MIEKAIGVIITAERRMFAKTIIDSDLFLDMPMSAQALYFHLAMRADDDGFVNNPKQIKRMVGASDDDLKVLIAKQYLLPFDSGVVVIRHWKIHNYIQSDRYKPTLCTEEKSQIDFKANKAYSYNTDTECIHNVSNMYTQDRLGKVSLDKVSLDKSKSKGGMGEKAKRFSPPSLEEVKAYCSERGNGIDAQHFIDYYTANGWKVGKNPMKDWKATVRTWERNGINPKKEDKHSYDLDEWEEFAMNFDPTKGAGDDG